MFIQGGCHEWRGPWRPRFPPNGAAVAAILAAVIAAAALGGLAWLFLSGGDDRDELLNIDPNSGRPMRVAIREPAPGARIPAADPVTIVVETLGAAKVARYELWADGALALQQTPSTGALPASSRLAWRPGSPGPHVLIARAFDAGGRMGRSEPVVVEAVASPDDGLIGITVEAQPGDTAASIAAAVSVDADAVRAPILGQEPRPGEQLVVMIPPDRLPEGYVDDDGAAPAGRAEPSPEPRGEDAGDAQPADDAAPDQLPWGFDRPGDPEPPDAPARLSAAHGGGCDVRLQWEDSSDSETGFRIYRLGNGGDFSPIRDIAANDALAVLNYTDRVLFGGHYEYYVASVNSGGESDSNLAGVDVPRDACAITSPGIAVDSAFMLQFEASSLQTETFDDAYCYLSLARLDPYARIPEHDDVFLAPTAGGGWDIDRWASGIARRVFMQPPREPVPVRMECWGSRGDEEPNLLGSFEASHPREEWDGRDLFGDADGFSLVYHIGPYIPRLRVVAIEDNRIPAPSNVHISDDRADCDAHADFSDRHELDGLAALWACAEIADHVVVWDWRESPAFPREEISGFRVRYRVIDDFAFGDDPPPWRSLGEIGPYAQLFPIPMPSCDERLYFKVTAVVRPADGSEERESPASPVFPVERRGCPPPQVQVEITLISLDVRDVDDGVRFRCALFVLCIPVYDFEVEAYGSGGFNVLRPGGLSQVDYGTNFLFFTHDCRGIGESFLTACQGFNPRPVGARIGIDETHIRFTDEQMVVCQSYRRCTDWGTGHNRITLTVQDGDSIEFWFNLRDDDVGSPDDTWCGTDEDYSFESEVDESIPVVIGPHSLEEWLTIFENVRWDNAANALDDQDANCTMHMFVDGSRIER